MTAALENEWDAGAGDAPADPPPPAPDGKDPDAPWGRTSSGKPRGKPGPKGPRTARAPGRRSSSSSSGRRRPQTPDYATGVKGLVQLVAAPLFMAGQKNVVALADAATLVAYAEPLGAGAQAVAESDAKVAQLLDRILAVGPYAALLAPVMGLAVQLGVNHNVVPLEMGRGLGAAAPEEVIASVIGQQAAA